MERNIFCPASTIEVDNDRAGQLLGKRLTRRQGEILTLLFNGVSGEKNLAERLGTSDRTVTVQLASLYRMFNTQGRDRLITVATEAGIVIIEPIIREEDTCIGKVGAELSPKQD